MKDKLICIAVLVLTAIGAMGQQDTLRYRITLRDKAATTYSLEHPEAYLSEKAIARRVRQQLPIDSTDLPVCRQYIKEIEQQGVGIVTTGKWENFVTVSCNDSTQIERIAALPFVKKAERVWKAPYSLVGTHPGASSVGANSEGGSKTQLRTHQDASLQTNCIVIAVIDAGFMGVDTMAAMQNVRILGARDFVTPGENVYATGSHGTMVLSRIAMNQPDIMTGTAPEASFWLLRSEDEESEQFVEQDYWAAAVEFADSVGVDVVNTSLGYYKFDDPAWNYEYRHLDGRHALISRQASRMADKGMVLVCSAGNSGEGTWKKITPPADADNVLTVGAIDRDGVVATFSSVGNTADGRTKPDVMALGVEAEVMYPDGTRGTANGTSFAAPTMCGMVARLWQARPELTAKQLIELVRSLGDRADFPDNIYGYGVPDFSLITNH